MKKTSLHSRLSPKALIDHVRDLIRLGHNQTMIAEAIGCHRTDLRRVLDQACDRIGEAPLEITSKGQRIASRIKPVTAEGSTKVPSIRMVEAGFRPGDMIEIEAGDGEIIIRRQGAPES